MAAREFLFYCRFNFCLAQINNAVIAGGDILNFIVTAQVLAEVARMAD